MKVRIGLMGFGRIGRNLFRQLYQRDDLTIAAISDIADPAALEYLLRYDTVLGRFPEEARIRDGVLRCRGRETRVLAGREPGDVPWGSLGVDVVVEATARYRSRREMTRHLEAGARRVILCVPPVDPPDITVVMGVNDALLRPEHRIVSNGSCTAHCAAPLLTILLEAFGVRRALLTTVHAYTSRDRLADVPDDDLRRGRAAAENIIPTTTNAAAMIQELIPALSGRLEAMAVNVPVPDGSLVDLTCWTERPADARAVNAAVRAAADGRLRGILAYEEDPIVSSDVIGNPHSSVFDAGSTLMVGDRLVKTVSWYDNGWGYASRVVNLIERFAALEAAVSPRVAINGFGRIGRSIMRLLSRRDDVDVVAVNDLFRPEALAYLLKYDTVMRTFDQDVRAEGSTLRVGARSIRLLASKDIAALPWRELGVDVVVEATGKFRARAELERHVAAGARRVLLTVPAKDAIDATIVIGVNDAVLRPEHRIVSNASCTTNCLAPVARVLDESFGIECGVMTTVHAYTNDQRLADVPHKDLRRSRAAAENIIPTTTGAARAVGMVLPGLKGKLDGVAMRVPVPDGSIVDLNVRLRGDPGAAEVNAALQAAATGPLRGILEYSDRPLVSSDVIGNPHSSIIDSLLTRSVGEGFVKVVAWYDNEWGYSCRVVDLIDRLARLG